MCIIIFSICRLTNDGIKKQFEQTLLALGVDKLDIFYIHMPDISVNIEEIFHTCNELYSQGLFNTLGISNFASWDVVRIHHLCNTRGWVVPKVYQGCYNALNTSVEHELLPALRTLNMSFYSYNPLAAGLLTGRYTAIEDFYAATTGRFSKEFDFVPKDNHDEQFRTIKGKAAEIYRDRYGSQNNFKAVKLLNEAKEPSDKLSNLSLRWLRHHSRLRAHFEDAIIFGASKIKQAEENLLSLTSGHLSSDMVEAFKESNQLTKAEAEPYFRNYDKKPGFADEFLNQYD